MMASIIRQNKVIYYIQAFLRSLLPADDYVSRIKSLKKKLTPQQLKEVEARVSYYNKLEDHVARSGQHSIKSLRKAQKPKVYYFDAYEYARFFDENLRLNHVFGDVTHIPEVPSLVKSRPVSADNQNSVLMSLNKVRHVKWIKNDRPFLQKKDMLIGRGTVFQEHRYRFYDLFFDHPLCDLGQVNKEGGNPRWWKPKISVQDHLAYKFILCLQGNDVATNLKWVMSSNSVAVMPKPTLETWFMEGTLTGGQHYIEIKSDYSDLEEQLRYYISHPDKCLEIINNANRHCAQFFNKHTEDLCNLLVLRKYFVE